ncbi:MAG TPA: hypothetical protein VFD66_09120 [Verrucomicrobiae bacterium]|nr:hypothetical protein [Verrucomicrobiae bacterium]
MPPLQGGKNFVITFPGPSLRSSPGYHIAGLRPSARHGADPSLEWVGMIKFRRMCIIQP